MYKMVFMLAFIIFNLLSNCSFAEEVTREFGNYYISIKSSKLPAKDHYEYSLKIRNKKTKIEKEIEFNSRMKSISNLYVTGDKCLVHGELGSGGDILTIINIDTGNVIDTIWGWSMSFPKDMRMAAYNFRYPPYGMPLYRTAVLLIYDFSKTPLENSMDETIGNPENRGFILYPEENRKRNIYFIPALSEDEQRSITSPIVWNNNSNMIGFLESLGGKTSLVTIDISRGLLNPKVNIQELDKRMFYKEQYKDTIDVTKDKSVISAKEIRFIDDRYVEIIPFGVGYYEEKKVKLILNKKVSKNNIINMKHEAFKLGWIATLLNEVEAQKDKHLTSEAYSLLKYNSQYLIERL